jgi:hypothetical protein
MTAYPMPRYGSPLKHTLTVGGGDVIVPNGWKSPLREHTGTGSKKKVLYQVVVETAEGPLRIGPAMVQSWADEFCAATAKAITQGKIHGWGMPQTIAIS